MFEEHRTNRDLIETIDVVCRPPKRVGKGLKQVREVPIASIARDLALPLHQIDTFRGWEPPSNPQGHPINLIVAVSFGLLVPPRLLKAAKYGGLNVHPSLLPDFRGAAPVHHTLLAGCTRTGVTLQTLHPSKMDHGQILAQTPPPGLAIPSPDAISVAELTAMLARAGADMLVDGLRAALFVPPVEDLTPRSIDETALRRAPRIVPEDCHVDWTSWSAATILRRQRLIGPLWSYFRTPDGKRRIIWSGGFERMGGAEDVVDVTGTAVVSERDGYLYVWTSDEEVLRARTVTVEGLAKNKPGIVAGKARLIDAERDIVVLE